MKTKLGALNFSRPRASSNASSIGGRITPPHGLLPQDLDDDGPPPLSPLSSSSFAAAPSKSFFVMFVVFNFEIVNLYFAFFKYLIMFIASKRHITHIYPPNGRYLKFQVPAINSRTCFYYQSDLIALRTLRIKIRCLIVLFKQALSSWSRPVVFKLFCVAAPLEVFDSTAAHLNLLYQTYCSSFTLLLNNFL